jgi:hypothetical protein
MKQGKETIVQNSPVSLRAMLGRVLGLLGLVCAVVGMFYIEGISIAFLGIIFGGLGYYFSLTSQDRMGQILGILAAVLSVVSIGANGLEGIPYGPIQ